MGGEYSRRIYALPRSEIDNQIVEIDQLLVSNTAIAIAESNIISPYINYYSVEKQSN